MAAESVAEGPNGPDRGGKWSTGGNGPGQGGARPWSRAGSRPGLLLAALWVLTLGLAVRQATAVLRLPQEERLVDLFAWIGDNGVLRLHGSLYDGDQPFTGTPFAGLVLKPLTRPAEQTLGVAWTFGTMLLVAAVGVLAARALPGPVARRTALCAVPAALSLLALSIPVRNTFHLGQTSVLPVLLVLAGWLLGGARGEPEAPHRAGKAPGERTAALPGAGAGRALLGAKTGGALIGVACALQPATVLFLPLLWFTGRRQAAVTGAGTFLLCTLATWVVMPGDSTAYWIHHVAGAGLGEPADATANQSLHGALLRAGLHGPAEIVLLALLSAVVGWLALRRAVRYARDGQPLLAAAIVGSAAVVASPVAWQHQQLWVLLAVVGRVGRRSGDRLVWPVFVAMVMTLDGSALVPKVAVFGVFGENAVLFAALLASCAVPFLRRDAPVWDAPEPMGALSRPNLMLELLLIRVWYWAYSWVRGHAPDSRSLAEGHGHQILDAESFLHLDVEHGLNKLAARTQWLRDACDFYYTTFHFLVPIALLAWLYARRVPRYRGARTALGCATLLGLVGFWLYPLAPPRLMPGLGYVDTAHGPQDLSNPDFGALTSLSNQYAAMPSLHVGWSLWCAVVVFMMTRNVWLRALGALYPLMTAFVVMATANHYLLDAVGGALAVVAGFAGARWLARLRERRASAAGVVPGGTDSGELPRPRPPGSGSVEGPSGGRTAGGPTRARAAAGPSRRRDAAGPSAGNAPAGSPPGGTAVGRPPADGATAGSSPVGGAAVGSSPVGGAAVGSSPVGEAAVGTSPVGGAAIEGSPVDGTADGGPPVGEAVGGRPPADGLADGGPPAGGAAADAPRGA
ncbi:phosphatase PAP2 family protein [Streptomyces sp. PU-14G]|uniref:phosphatase PAP2 family protein n=1 Tax=Streptomyces sp. PU-14G TaxID=2800808 RepID=UPI0034E0449B